MMRTFDLCSFFQALAIIGAPEVDALFELLALAFGAGPNIDIWALAANGRALAPISAKQKQWHNDLSWRRFIKDLSLLALANTPYI